MVAVAKGEVPVEAVEEAAAEATPAAETKPEAAAAE